MEEFHCLIEQLDHVVLTTAHEDACVRFNCTVLGLVRNGQTIKLHVQRQEFEPKARFLTPGALDLCFISSVPLAQVQHQLAQYGIATAIECGPVQCIAARVVMCSVYVRGSNHKLINF